jgi:hypothetical protein
MLKITALVLSSFLIASSIKALEIEGSCKLSYSRTQGGSLYNITFSGPMAGKFYTALYDLKIPAAHGEDENFLNYTRSTNEIRCSRFTSKETKEDSFACGSGFDSSGRAGMPHKFNLADKIQIVEKCQLKITDNGNFVMQFYQAIGKHAWDNSTLFKATRNTEIEARQSMLAYTKWSTHLYSHEVKEAGEDIKYRANLHFRATLGIFTNMTE